MKKAALLVMIFVMLFMILAACCSVSAADSVTIEEKVEEYRAVYRNKYINGSSYMTDSEDGECRAKPTPAFAAMGTERQENQVGDYWAVLDSSNISDGYIGVQAKGVESQVGYVHIEKDGVQNRYNIAADGNDQFVPFSLGNGEYRIVVLVQREIAEPEQPSDFVTVLETVVNVKMRSETAPFLLNNSVVKYDCESDVVIMAYEITKHAEDEMQIVQLATSWIQDNVVYDFETASDPPKLDQYYTHPDRTIRRGIGLCYDNAILFAAIMRINGIPCKVVTGDIRDSKSSTIYHAWNQVWLADKGWVIVDTLSLATEIHDPIEEPALYRAA